MNWDEDENLVTKYQAFYLLVIYTAILLSLFPHCYAFTISWLITKLITGLPAHKNGWVVFHYMYVPYLHWKNSLFVFRAQPNVISYMKLLPLLKQTHPLSLKPSTKVKKERICPSLHTLPYSVCLVKAIPGLKLELWNASLCPQEEVVKMQTSERYITSKD